MAELLSVGKPATASSEEAGQGNNITDGNDGLGATRWCAANGNVDHWWAVDLEQSYVLTEIEINWEKAAAYQYLIESSDNGSVWSPLVDETDNTNALQVQSLPIAGAPEARHVRITVTGLPASSWASFFEFSVYGYEP